LLKCTAADAEFTLAEKSCREYIVLVILNLVSEKTNGEGKKFIAALSFFGLSACSQP